MNQKDIDSISMDQDSLTHAQTHNPIQGSCEMEEFCSNQVVCVELINLTAKWEVFVWNLCFGAWNKTFTIVAYSLLQS